MQHKEHSPDGLTEDELRRVAEEAGIRNDILEEAMLTFDTTSEQVEFNWLNATNNIQKIARLPGQIDENNWEEMVQEIRRITGGIGKVVNTGQSFEWEQRRKDIGYKHISVTPGDDTTKVQMVSNWRGLKLTIYVLSFMATFTLSAIVLDGSSVSKIPTLLLAFGSGLLGLPIGQLYLKSYFDKQKKQIKDIFSAFGKIAKRDRESRITIEDQEVYTAPKDPSSSTSIKDRH